MEKIFLDTNVVLDIIEERPDVVYARRILEYASNDTFIHVYISYLSVANSAFILRKRKKEDIISNINSLMRTVNVLSSNDMQILEALKSGSPDFEDALQIACAESRNCDVIITRNPEHFRNYTEIPVITPADFVSHCSK